MPAKRLDCIGRSSGSVRHPNLLEWRHGTAKLLRAGLRCRKPRASSQGRISIKNREYSAQEQAELLRGEGVEVSEELKIDLDTFLWEGLHWVEVDDILRDT